MSFFSSQKTWFFVAMFLLVVNIVLIGGFFMWRGEHRTEMRSFHEKGGRKHREALMLHSTIIADSLQFSEGQRTQLTKLETILDARKDSVFNASKTCRKEFTKQLFSDEPDSAKMNELTLCISRNTELYNKIRIERIFGIRSICNAAQLKQFNSMLSRLKEKHYHDSHHQ